MSIQIAMFALIGGLGTVFGPLVGTVLVLPIAEPARGWLSDFGNGFHGLVYGIVLVVVVLTIPKGLVGRFGAPFMRWVDRLPGGRAGAGQALSWSPGTSTRSSEREDDGPHGGFRARSDPAGNATDQAGGLHRDQ